MMAENPCWLGVAAAWVLVCASASVAATGGAQEGFHLMLDTNSGHLRSVGNAAVKAQFEVAQDLIAVKTSNGEVRNDPDTLISHEQEDGKHRFVYRSEAIDLVVVWDRGQGFAERIWRVVPRQPVTCRVVRVAETLRFREPFQRIDLHTDGSVYRVPINLFLRARTMSLGIGITYPWVNLRAPKRNAVAMSYEIEVDVAAGGSFESETTFIVPCPYVGAVCTKGANMGTRFLKVKKDEPMDYGEVWAMQDYLAHYAPEQPLPVDGYFTWLNGWWAALRAKLPDNVLVDRMAALGVRDVMTPYMWYGSGGTHPGGGGRPCRMKPGERLEPSQTCAKWMAYARQKGSCVGSFCQPANPFFGNKAWLSVGKNGTPNGYIRSQYNCFGNEAFVKAFTDLQIQVLGDAQARFWGWDGQMLSYREADKAQHAQIPCYGTGHGHLPGKQYFQEYRNLREMFRRIRAAFPRICLQVYWGVKRGTPWIMRSLNAIEGYYEAGGPVDQRDQAWHNQHYRFLPAYFNWMHLDSPDPKGFEVSMISAISGSTHMQIGKCITGVDDPANIATFKKWMKFVDSIRPFLSRKRDLFGRPGLDWIDGSAHCIDDRGYLFIFNTSRLNEYAHKRSIARPENTVPVVPLDHRIRLTRGSRYAVIRIHPGEEEIVGVFAPGDSVPVAAEAPAEVYRIEPSTEPLTKPEIPQNAVLFPAFPPGDVLQALEKQLDLCTGVSPMDPEAARWCVKILFGENEATATEAASALRNVQPAAQPVADAAFQRCREDGRPHLLTLGIQGALARREPQPKIVTRALEAAARRGDAQRFVAILSAVPSGHRLRAEILGAALPPVLAGKSTKMANTCIDYVISAKAAELDEPARATVRAALFGLLDTPGALTRGNLIRAVLAFAPKPTELELRWQVALVKAVADSDYDAAAGILSVVPADSPHADAAKFLPQALHCVKSERDAAVASGMRFVRAYGVPGLSDAQKREWVAALVAVLEGKGGGRREAVTLLAQFGRSARSAMPVLRRVYLESSMQEIAGAAIKAIDPKAKVTEVDPEIDLDL